MAKRIAKHREGTAQIYFWDEEIVKQKLQERVKLSGIPHFTTSDYLRALVRRDLGLAPNPSAPVQESHNPRKRPRRVA